MKNLKSFLRTLLPLVCLLVMTCSMAQAQVPEQTPGVPNVFNPYESAFQQQTHFLVFTGTDTAGENAATATAYYNAIDPGAHKRNFTQWLVNAGFIANESQWHPTGTQLIACDLPGCDLPSHTNGSLTYGDNVLNTDSHAIVLNAADLGFVRNQFIRCKPSCSAANPIIYTYLENYPVNPFAASGAGGSGFPIKTGYPTQAEAKSAIESALNRPSGDLVSCNSATTDTAFGCSIQRIADVAFEWAPPPNNPTSSARYGQLYAYIFTFVSGVASETIGFPGAGGVTPNLATHQLEPFFGAGTTGNILTADPFPPNLDFIGFKQHPGVCYICHGGNPKKLNIATTPPTYPNQGRVDGFRFLPLDNRNLMFTSDAGSETTSRAGEEPQIKAYNLAVLKTVNQRAQLDEQGTLRQPHLAEVIKGWYAGSSSIQNADFIPVGWQEISGAPAGSERLYKTVLAPSCRSCHFNRELTLDFGTATNFKAYKADVLEYALLPLCNGNHPQAGFRPMPLAHLTYQRFWQANATPQTLPDGTVLANTADQIAQYFGFSSAAGYCAAPR